MKTILCIDDSETIRTTMSLFISDAGYEVITVTNGIKAMEVLAKMKRLPKLIFLDIMMPEMDGISVLKQLKEHEQFKFIPVCILSTVNEKEKIDEGMKIGACSWVFKPCKPDDLFKILSRYAG